MEFRILGPIEATEAGRSVALGPAKQRALLAALLMHANEVVSTDRLVDELWGERPPAKAAKSVQVYVSQLRKALGDGALETSGHGYRLHVAAGALDSEHFESLLAAGREALAEGEASRAAETLRAALALWRGPALSDVAYEPSPRPRSHGSRSCVSRRSRNGSMPTSRWVATRTSSPSSRVSSARSRCANGSGDS